MKTCQTSGFALLLVLWTLVVLSTIALTLAASVGSEVLSAQESWNDLQAERLANSGHEFAAYLETRSLGTPLEDLSQLPVEPVIPGRTYRIRLEAGTIELSYEGENGKLDLANAGENAAAEFFSSWTGDRAKGERIAAALADWKDADDEARPLGAESANYSGRGYLPRNAGLGSADLFLVEGLSAADFAPTIAESATGPTVRPPLSRFLASASTGNLINPNYASPRILQTIPEITPALVQSIVQVRQQSLLKNREDLGARTGIPLDSPVMTRLTFDRGLAPSIFSEASIKNSSTKRSERRTRVFVPDTLGRFSGSTRLWLVERGSMPQ